MYKIKRNDTVQVIKGKDSGKRGKVLAILPERNKAIVEGINFVKKHKRQTRQDQQGGIVSIETPIAIANLLIYCKTCDKPVRVGFTVTKDNAKTRICKSCKEAI